MRYILLFFIFLINIVNLNAQRPNKSSASEIFQSIQKLNFLGTVLYVAAHPDDENTRLISYFSNNVKARTGYLSITRGDGGQNLIGTELQELLGVIRTQELLAARRIDGGEQFFTRAFDFGFDPFLPVKYGNGRRQKSSVIPSKKSLKHLVYKRKALRLYASWRPLLARR